MIQSRHDLRKARRVVIKIGSSLLADATHGVQSERMRHIATTVAQLHGEGKQICLISSGAVALGCVHLGWVGRTLTVHEKQAAAAVGQPLLMRAWGDAFAAHHITPAQMLLNKDDLRHRRRYINTSNTSRTLFDAGIVPIVNENDTVMVAEIKFGDNDSLASLTSLVIESNLLILMTDVNGLHDSNPLTNRSARRLANIHQWSSDLLRMVEESSGSFGSGGMESKLKAARVALRGGVATAMIDGSNEAALPALLRGEDVGTLFYCSDDRATRRSHWIAEVLQVAGTITVDAGAAQALLYRGSSLLPIGMKRVVGIFDKGDCISISDEHGNEIARGLANYTAEEMRLLCGLASDQIETKIGYVDYTSMIHRDNMVITRVASRSPGTTEGSTVRKHGVTKSAAAREAVTSVKE
ncbi:MAG: glutamate 5-kinase [Mariprofundales bacterium]|nr:glutamate 5-kinase [Mariprofundales bacterium]